MTSGEQFEAMIYSNFNTSRHHYLLSTLAQETEIKNEVDSVMI